MSSLADELRALVELRKEGALSDEEFATAKALTLRRREQQQQQTASPSAASEKSNSSPDWSTSVTAATESSVVVVHPPSLFLSPSSSPGPAPAAAPSSTSLTRDEQIKSPPQQQHQQSLSTRASTAMTPPPRTPAEQTLEHMKEANMYRARDNLFRKCEKDFCADLHAAAVALLVSSSQQQQQQQQHHSSSCASFGVAVASQFVHSSAMQVEGPPLPLRCPLHPRSIKDPVNFFPAVFVSFFDVVVPAAARSLNNNIDDGVDGKHRQQTNDTKSSLSTLRTLTLLVSMRTGAFYGLHAHENLRGWSVLVEAMEKLARRTSCRDGGGSYTDFVFERDQNNNDGNNNHNFSLANLKHWILSGLALLVATSTSSAATVFDYLVRRIPLYAPPDPGKRNSAAAQQRQRGKIFSAAAIMMKKNNKKLTAKGEDDAVVCCGEVDGLLRGVSFIPPQQQEQQQQQHQSNNNNNNVTKPTTVAVGAVSVSPDGRFVALGSVPGTARIFNWCQSNFDPVAKIDDPEIVRKNNGGVEQENHHLPNNTYLFISWRPHHFTNSRRGKKSYRIAAGSFTGIHFIDFYPDEEGGQGTHPDTPTAETTKTLLRARFVASGASGAAAHAVQYSPDGQRLLVIIRENKQTTIRTLPGDYDGSLHQAMRISMFQSPLCQLPRHVDPAALSSRQTSSLLCFGWSSASASDSDSTTRNNDLLTSSSQQPQQQPPLVALPRRPKILFLCSPTVDEDDGFERTSCLYDVETNTIHDYRNDSNVPRQDNYPTSKEEQTKQATELMSQFVWRGRFEIPNRAVFRNAPATGCSFVQNPLDKRLGLMLPLYRRVEDFSKSSFSLPLLLLQSTGAGSIIAAGDVSFSFFEFADWKSVALVDELFLRNFKMPLDVPEEEEPPEITLTRVERGLHEAADVKVFKLVADEDDAEDVPPPPPMPTVVVGKKDKASSSSSSSSLMVQSTQQPSRNVFVYSSELYRLS